MYKFLDIPGWFNMHDAYMHLVKLCEPEDEIVEIGCFCGRSTRFLCDSLVASGKTDVIVHVIDTFEGSGPEMPNVDTSKILDIFMENLKEHIDAKRVKIHINRSDNKELLEEFSEDFLLGVIVDGSHEAKDVKMDIRNWWPKVKDKGIMVGDDASWSGVINGIKEGFSPFFSNSTVDILSGTECWFAKTKGDIDINYKMNPGHNCLKK